MKILLVEDNKKTATLVQKRLAAEGFEIQLLHEGSAALPLIEKENFDLLLLDIMLPGMDGLSIVKSLRQAGQTTPVLLLSARGEVQEKVEGLDAGADDYLPKPFAMDELVARIRALTRRNPVAAPTTLKVGDLTLDCIKRVARRGNRTIELSAREFRVLEFLMRSAGRICGRMDIVQEVWEYDFDPGTNLIDVYIMRLREKIDNDFETKLLQTIRGVGYVLREPQ
ncbi:MAG: response regulator [Verrucomicrobiota bacterium]|jgi:DNA-binding response OmpR family regulator